jgi:hypothetical protein
MNFSAYTTAICVAVVVLVSANCRAADTGTVTCTR